MEKLNVRFESSISPLLKELADNTSSTFSECAREAMTTGISAMMLNLEDGELVVKKLNSTIKGE